VSQISTGVPTSHELTLAGLVTVMRRRRKIIALTSVTFVLALPQAGFRRGVPK
jgi:hypothetical protein